MVLMIIVIQAPRFYKKRDFFVFLKFQFYDIQKLGKKNSQKLAKLIKLILPKKFQFYFIWLNNRICRQIKTNQQWEWKVGPQKVGRG
jgi:hypothetical protein